jgi:hypothetical protein
MAAVDAFRHFNESLPREFRLMLADLQKQTSDELLAARSEGARNRIVDLYVREVNVRMKRPTGVSSSSRSL